MTMIFAGPTELDRIAVDVGGVGQVDPEIERAVHGLSASVLFSGHPEVHGAERQTTDLQFVAAEISVLQRQASSPRKTCFATAIAAIAWGQPV